MAAGLDRLAGKGLAASGGRAAASELTLGAQAEPLESHHDRNPDVFILFDFDVDASSRIPIIRRVWLAVQPHPSITTRLSSSAMHLARAEAAVTLVFPRRYSSDPSSEMYSLLQTQYCFAAMVCRLSDTVIGLYGVILYQKLLEPERLPSC